MVVEPGEGESLYFPQLLRDRRTLLFTVAGGGRSNPLTVSYALDTGERRILIDGGSDARCVPTGHLVYRVGTTLQAVRFDPAELEMAQGATTVVEDVGPVVGGADRGGAHFAVADSGDFFYLSGAVSAARLVWRDRKGVSEPLSIPPAPYRPLHTKAFRSLQTELGW